MLEMLTGIGVFLAVVIGIAIVFEFSSAVLSVAIHFVFRETWEESFKSGPPAFRALLMVGFLLFCIYQIGSMVLGRW